MITMVTKRDGRIVPYDENKIRTAISLAIKSADLDTKDISKILDDVIDSVNTYLHDAEDYNDTIDIETIQDIVIKSMKDNNYTKIAKSYTSYRNKRTKIRERKSSLMQQIKEMAELDAAHSDSKRENANINGDTAMGTMLKYGTTTSKEYYLREVIPEDASNLHRDGSIHIHDMDFYSLTETCCQIPLGKLLKNGFATGHGFLRSPANIDSASALTCIAIQSNQNDQHGGQSIPKFDYDLAPFVAKTFIIRICEYLEDNEISEDDVNELRVKLKEYLNTHTSLMTDNALNYIRELIYKLTENYSLIDNCIDRALKRVNRDTYQAMEALIHNLNTMQSRAGSQVPFSSINYGTDTSPEGRMVIKNVLLAQEAGLGNGETPIFPIAIFKLKSGVNYNPEDPNYDLFKLACKVSAKRLFPNFSNIDAPYNLQFYKEGNPDTEIAYMGCVTENETIRYTYNNKMYNTTFKELYELVSSNFTPISYSSKSNYYITSSVISVYDSTVHRYVDCKKFIVNQDVTNWLTIKFDNGMSLTCTTDHPLPVYNTDSLESVRTLAIDLCVGDNIALSDVISAELTFTKIVSITPIEMVASSYDVETETDRFDVSGICSHNCRTRVISDITDKDNQIVTGRGNLSFTSINLPRIAIEADGDITKFYKDLDSLMEICKNQLLHRFKIQCSKTLKNYPFLMGQGVWIHSEELGIDDTLEEVLKHGTLSIGFIGLAETLIALIGKHHGESEEAQKLGLEIIKHMRQYMDKLSEEYNLNFSLLATPAEGLSGRFVRIDKKRYGIIDGVTDKDYYTNSFHVPPYYNISAYDKIRIEAPYHTLTNAGHISYIELDGDPSENLEAFESVVRCMHDMDIGYGAVNHPIDRDPVCGYTGIIGDVCPCCGRKEGEALTPEVYRNIIAKNRLGGIHV